MQEGVVTGTLTMVVLAALGQARTAFCPLAIAQRRAPKRQFGLAEPVDAGRRCRRVES